MDRLVLSKLFDTRGWRERERQWLKERRKNENRSVLFIEILRYGNDKTAFTNGCFSCHNSV